MVWLVIGLGNPGDEYANTRHNIGAMVVDELAKRHNVKWSSHKSRTEVAALKLGFGIDAFISRGADAVESLITVGLETTQQNFNI